MRNLFPGWIDSLAPAAVLRRESPLHTAGLALVAVVFVLLSTLIVAFDSIFQTQDNIASLQVGSIVGEDVRAPFSVTYVSDVLTERARQTAMESISPIYDPPDPNVARQQIILLQQVLDFIDNVRRDPFGTPQQKINDVSQITALQLDAAIIQSLLEFDDETWRSVVGEAVSVLERVMRESIRETDLSLMGDQLPSQVALRFDTRTASVIVALVEDLLRPNRFPNPTATDQARQAAASAISPESRSFERGQIVVRAGARIDAVDYEALDHLGLLESPDRRAQAVAQAFLASLIVMVAVGLYIARLPGEDFARVRFLSVMAGIFLVTLLGARLFSGQFYLFPAAAMALTLVIITRNEVAIISTIGLGLLVGIMANNSLEIAMLVIISGIVGALLMRHSERLNSYFFAGLVIALSNVVIVTLFNLGLLGAQEGTTLGTLVIFAIVNGVISAMAALVAMYAITLIFNLPTSLKLVELSQPNQPLLQRLLREAPGTYQHSLQVANLSEQAALAVGANAELMRVAALYHDIGKMLNPAFFVENQADNVNPHEVLNDPYRSADIIISHVTDGEKLARQYRLPARLRDFILEHHGTTLVSYFYTRAVEQAGDEEAVDIEQFTYQGPKPQTRETAIMMLADSCESTVRARKPSNRAEIVEIVDSLIDNRMRDGQLEEANLTLRDISITRDVFVEMLQAVFHPRINYPSLPAKRASGETAPALSAPARDELETGEMTAKIETGEHAVAEPAAPPRIARTQTIEFPTVKLDEDTPMPEVPPLRRTQRMNTVEENPREENSETEKKEES